MHGPLFILSVNFLLLIELLFVSFLSVLSCVLRVHQPFIQRTSVIANGIDILFNHCFLVIKHLFDHILVLHHLKWHSFLLGVKLSVRFDQVIQQFSYLLCNEWYRPFKNVHEVGQQIWMLVFQKLLDVKSVVLSRCSCTLNFMTAPLLL